MAMNFLIAAGVVAVAMAMSHRRWRRSAIALFGVAALTLTSAAPAMAAQDGTAPRVFEETITKASSSQFEGIVMQVGGSQAQQRSDRQIQKDIRDIVGKDLTIDVDSGAVILSGSVKDEETAREILEQVEQVEGVRDITFELGLTG